MLGIGKFFEGITIKTIKEMKGQRKLNSILAMLMQITLVILVFKSLTTIEFLGLALLAGVFSIIYHINARYWDMKLFIMEQNEKDVN